jgi:hypothetical protein
VRASAASGLAPRWLIACAAAIIPLPPAAPPSDACTLLTQDQVSGVLGIPVDAGHHLVPSSPSLCGWGKEGPTGKRVVLTIYTQMGSRTPVDRFNTAKTPIQGVTKTPVSGVGDDAVSVTTPGFGTGLIFRKGDSAFDVRVYGFPLDQLQAKEKALALDIITKI